MSSNPIKTPFALVVEDDPDAAETLIMLIEMEGFQGVAADTLAEARRHVANRVPDIALLDHRLPDGSGMELIAELAARGVTTIMLTGSGDPELIEQAKRRGAAGYLLKPVDIEALTGFLAQVRDA